MLPSKGKRILPRERIDRTLKPGSMHKRVYPKRVKWRQMTVLGLWRCPDCRALIAHHRGYMRDIYAHELWHDEETEMVDDILSRLEELERKTQDVS